MIFLFFRPQIGRTVQKLVFFEDSSSYCLRRLRTSVQAKRTEKTLSPPAEKVVRTQKSNSGQNFGSFRKIYMAHSKSSYNNKTDQQIG